MSLRAILRPRPVVLVLLWLLPTLVYVVIGAMAMYETGWLAIVAISLPILWLTSWLVARLWPATASRQVADGQRLVAQPHWTPRDIQAISVIETYRNEVAPLRFEDLSQNERYVKDVTELAKRLTQHYFQREDDTVVSNLTLVELLAIIHLATADIEDWVAANVPGSKIVKIKTLSHAPSAAKSIEWFQNATFIATAIVNPARLASYPLWKMSGKVFTELRHELIQSVYQRFLRQIGFYLIEMYSGRLRGGSHEYEKYFRQTSEATYELELRGREHAMRAGNLEAGDDLAAGGEDEFKYGDVSIAIMGQVKAGKSSLLNHLLRSQTAVTGVLPETREVASHTLEIPAITSRVRLLDTPGYSEDGAKKQQLDAIRMAAENSNLLLLVLSAVSPAKQADVDLLGHLRQYYARHPQLKPPPVIAVVTHIDQLSPRREWSPPYDWKNPKSAKEQSISEAAAYARETLGPTVRDVICVYTGDERSQGNSQVLEEIIPVVAQLLPEGQAAALLCAYYRQINQHRLSEVLKQLGRLGSTLTGSLIDRFLERSFKSKDQ